MWIQRTLIAVAILIAAAAVWRYRQPLGLGALLAPVEQRAADIRFDNDHLREFEPRPESVGSDGEPATPVKRLRKCVKGGAVTYTDQPCAPGSRELPVSKDQLSIVPGNPAPPPDAGRAGKTVRDALAPPPGEESIKDKQMDRVIGR